MNPSSKLFKVLVAGYRNPKHRLSIYILKREIDSMRALVNSDRVSISGEEPFADFVQIATMFIEDGNDPALGGN